MFGISVLMFMQFTYIWRLNWKKIAEEVCVHSQQIEFKTIIYQINYEFKAHKLGELENGEKIVELKIFNNPNFESIEDNSKQKKLDIFSIEIKTEEDENEKSEKKKNLPEG